VCTIILFVTSFNLVQENCDLSLHMYKGLLLVLVANIIRQIFLAVFFFFDQHLSGSIKPLENQNLIFTNVRLKLKMRTTARTK